MAEQDLTRLLKSLKVERIDGLWQFETSEQKSLHPQMAMLFREREGWTCIRPVDGYTKLDNRWVWLELSVYSDLHAVGFLAKVADVLATAGVPCNAVAAFHHDHIFVPEGKADTAISALNALASRS